MNFEMSCPSCHYHYFVENIHRYEGQVEVCPTCGRKDKFEVFVVRKYKKGEK